MHGKFGFCDKVSKNYACYWRPAQDLHLIYTIMCTYRQSLSQSMNFQRTEGQQPESRVDYVVWRKPLIWDYLLCPTQSLPGANEPMNGVSSSAKFDLCQTNRFSIPHWPSPLTSFRSDSSTASCSSVYSSFRSPSLKELCFREYAD